MDRDTREFDREVEIALVEAITPIVNEDIPKHVMGKLEVIARQYNALPPAIIQEADSMLKGPTTAKEISEKWRTVLESPMLLARLRVLGARLRTIHLECIEKIMKEGGH
jgi:hypothetical protein